MGSDDFTSDYRLYCNLIKSVNKNDPMKPDFIYYLAMWADDRITDVYICNHGHIH